MKTKIDQVIIVEGRDDIINLKKYFDAEIIATHGYGISQQTIKRIETAYKNKGIIILTDPDFAGEKIRKRLNLMFPNASNAFISRQDALKDDNVGIENAAGDVLTDALLKVHQISTSTKEEFQRSDLMKNGLIGENDSSNKRNLLGKILGIGYANGKQLLGRLNGYGITREAFDLAMKEVKKHV